MYAFDEQCRHYPGEGCLPGCRPRGVMVLGGRASAGSGARLAVYNSCKIDIGTGQQAVLIRLEGLEL